MININYKNSKFSNFLLSVFPSNNDKKNIAIILLLSSVFSIIFLFAGGYHFPGGASHYPNWANSIVSGIPLPPSHAQREVGLPLLYLLSGFPWHGSFIPITVFYSIFGFSIPIIVYASLKRFSKKIAYLITIICIFSFAPYTYTKFFYPDQLYIFLNLILIISLILYFQNKKILFLILFIFSAILSSYTRTAGFLIFPFIIFILLILDFKNLKIYLLCFIIYILSLGLYSYHRHIIFDIKNQENFPSGKGMQMFYSTYLYLGDFGYKLDPKNGPNTKILFELLHNALTPNVRESNLIKLKIGNSPDEFMDNYFYKFTSEELIDKIATQPNEEYIWNVLYELQPNNDLFYLNIAKEIAFSYPLYIFKYSTRNLYHLLFKPGYAVPRYSTVGFVRQDPEFIAHVSGFGRRSEDPVIQYGARAEKELSFIQIKTLPLGIQNIFLKFEKIFSKTHRKYINATSIPIIILWIYFLFLFASFVFKYKKIYFINKEINSDNLIFIALIPTSILLYENIVTAFFCQPSFRYFHMTEIPRLIIAGFGLIFLNRILNKFNLKPKFNLQDVGLKYKENVLSRIIYSTIIFYMIGIIIWIIHIYLNT